ncbi:MAG TPA: transporter, partial [Pseudomonas sp.]|nr:transporter [Pseudomonas sp.]
MASILHPIKRGLAAVALLGLALPALAQTTVSGAW